MGEARRLFNAQEGDGRGRGGRVDTVEHGWGGKLAWGAGLGGESAWGTEWVGELGDLLEGVVPAVGARRIGREGDAEDVDGNATGAKLEEPTIRLDACVQVLHTLPSLPTKTLYREDMRYKTPFRDIVPKSASAGHESETCLKVSQFQLAAWGHK